MELLPKLPCGKIFHHTSFLIVAWRVFINETTAFINCLDPFIIILALPKALSNKYLREFDLPYNLDSHSSKCFDIILLLICTKEKPKLNGWHFIF